MIKRYLIEAEYDESGNRCSLTRTNDSFAAFELLGILVDAALDIRERINGRIETPAVVKRQIIEEGIKNIRKTKERKK